MRVVTFFCLFIAIVTGAALYFVSQEVQSTEARLRQLNREIVKQEEAIHVLRAEWSYLNTPGRLKKLAAEHTALKPADGEQIAVVSDLPDRPPEPETPEVKPGAGGAPLAADLLADGPDAPELADTEKPVMAALKLPPLPKHKPRAPQMPVQRRTVTADHPVTIKTAAQEKPETGPAPRETERQFDMLLADLTGE